MNRQIVYVSNKNPKRTITVTEFIHPDGTECIDTKVDGFGALTETDDWTSAAVRARFTNFSTPYSLDGSSNEMWFGSVEEVAVVTIGKAIKPFTKDGRKYFREPFDVAVNGRVIASTADGAVADTALLSAVSALKAIGKTVHTINLDEEV